MSNKERLEQNNLDLAEIKAKIQRIPKVNNQDKTITSNGIYTADAGYSGLGEITVEVEGGPSYPIPKVVKGNGQAVTATINQLAIGTAEDIGKVAYLFIMHRSPITQISTTAGSFKLLYTFEHTGSITQYVSVYSGKLIGSYLTSINQRDNARLDVAYAIVENEINPIQLFNSVFNDTSETTVISDIKKGDIIAADAISLLNDSTPDNAITITGNFTKYTDINHVSRMAVFVAEEDMETATVRCNLTNGAAYSVITQYRYGTQIQNLTPENIRKDVEILDVVGSLSLDAGATEYFIDGSEITVSTTSVNFSQLIRRIPDLYEGVEFKNCYGMFSNMHNLIQVPKLTLNSCLNTVSMFANCKNISNIPQANYNSVTQANYMFNGCTSLEDLEDLSFPKAINCVNMFSGCISIKNAINLNFQSINNATHMFYGCSSLSEVKNITMNNVYAMTNAFGGCTNLKTVSNITIGSNIYSLDSMFRYCERLESIENITWNTGNIGTIANAFENCRNLEYLEPFNTSKIGTMYYAFTRCAKLESIPDITSNTLYNMGFAFVGCTNLKAIPNINTANVSYMNSAFSGCASITDAPELVFTKCGNAANLFVGCKSLVNVPAYNFVNSTIGGMYDGCNNLVNVGEFTVTYTGATNICNMFRFCNNLSDASINNAINSFLKITPRYWNLRTSNVYSPFYMSNITNERYPDRVAELQAKGYIV